MARSNHTGKMPVFPGTIDMVVGIARTRLMTDPAVVFGMNMRHGRVSRMVLEDAVLGGGRGRTGWLNPNRPVLGNVTGPHFGWPFPSGTAALSKGSCAGEDSPSENNQEEHTGSDTHFHSSNSSFVDRVC